MSSTEQDLRNGSSVPWIVAGAAIGLGVLFLMDPLHGERNRTRVKARCSEFDKKCRGSLAQKFVQWRDQLNGTTRGIRAEIRAHAPQYLQ